LIVSEKYYRTFREVYIINIMGHNKRKKLFYSSFVKNKNSLCFKGSLSVITSNCDYAVMWLAILL